MPISARAGAALAIALAAIPAIAQSGRQDRPESILPPGFGEPAVAPTPTPRATGTAPAAVPGTPATAPSSAIVEPLPDGSSTPTDTPSPSPTPIDAATLAQYELPSFARRSLALIGPAGPREGGLSADAFGDVDGRYLERLMRRTAAPLPSRWLSILLRRTLASSIETPTGVNGADFAAERAWLLLRMGEATAARAVVQGVDTGNYTPKLYQVAMNAALATGDPGALCPLADRASAVTGERGWAMAQAMCASLAGEGARARALLTAARRRNLATGIDLQLVRKVVGAGPNGGQAVTIEWAGVSPLNVWRFGLATATGVTVPADLFPTTGRQAFYWYALAPGVPLGERIAAADAAAAQGVLSNAALVDLYGGVAEADDMPGAAGAAAADLRTAYAGGDADTRLGAIRQLWGEGTPDYARLVLTARAAGRLPVRSGLPDASTLVSSMLAAGLDRNAVRWRDSVGEGGDAWAMIALADPDPGLRIRYADLAAYSGGGDAALKRRFLFAGLAGLGRLSPEDIGRAAESLDIRIGTENSWTRAIDRAAAAGEPGTVVVLAAIGMQTPVWRGVPPAMLYRIVRALRAVGLEGEARMIAAEAIARA